MAIVLCCCYVIKVSAPKYCHNTWSVWKRTVFAEAETDIAISSLFSLCIESKIIVISLESATETLVWSGPRSCVWRGAPRGDRVQTITQSYISANQLARGCATYSPAQPATKTNNTELPINSLFLFATVVCGERNGLKNLKVISECFIQGVLWQVILGLPVFPAETLCFDYKRRLLQIIVFVEYRQVFGLHLL